MNFIRLCGFFCVAFLAFSQTSHAGGGGGEEKEGGGKEYVEMKPLMLPVIDNYGVSQVVSLVISLEVDGVFDADKVKEMSPRLTDAYIQNMYGAMNESVGIKNGIIQVGIIKDRLNGVTSDVLGDEVHAEVLLQVVQQQPI